MEVSIVRHAERLLQEAIGFEIPKERLFSKLGKSTGNG